MLPLVSHGANLFNLCSFPDLSAFMCKIDSQSVQPFDRNFSVFWIVDPIKLPTMPPWGIVGLIVWAYVHSQMNPQTCTKRGPNRSSRLTASRDILNVWPPNPPPPPPDMPHGVLRGNLYLAYAHSQMNPQTWTKVGAIRSSRLTASSDFWMFDPINPPPSALLCLSGQFVWRISIPRWICTCVPNLMPIGPAVGYLPLTCECVTP